MAEDDELLTVAEVAQRLKLHQETVRRWIREGKLPAIRLGRTQAGYRVRNSDLQLFLAGSKQLELPGDDSGNWRPERTRPPAESTARSLARARGTRIVDQQS